MKRAKARRLFDPVWRLPPRDGAAVEVPMERALAIGAGQLRWLATQTEGGEQSNYANKAAVYENEAARLAEERAVATHYHDKRSRGGKKTALVNKAKAKPKNDAMLTAAKAVRRDEPNIKAEALAGMLSDAGHGGKEAILQKLRRRRNQK